VEYEKFLSVEKSIPISVFHVGISAQGNLHPISQIIIIRVRQKRTGIPVVFLDVGETILVIIVQLIGFDKWIECAVKKGRNGNGWGVASNK
jgi:hypothetical protein